MAKKEAGQRQGDTKQFDGMEDDTPPKLLDMAVLLQKEMEAEAKAKAATKQTRGSLCDEMVSLKIDRFRFSSNGVIKWIELDEIQKIKIVKSEAHKDNFDSGEQS